MNHQKFVGGFALSSWVWEGQHASTGKSVSWSLAHSSRSSFHSRSPEHQELWDLNWSARPSPAVMTTSFFLIFSEHPWDKLRVNRPYFQFLPNNCVYSYHTDIKLCTYCLYRHRTVLIHEILYLAELWCSDFLTPPASLIILCRLLGIPESLKPLKNWCSIDARWSKSSLYVSVAFFQCLKHNSISYCSSKVSSRPDYIFEIHQLWQSGFSRVYCNCCCSCSFAAEIINVGRSSHKIYSNNLLNFQESTTILNACTKNWRLIEGTSYIYIYIYI